MTAFIASCLPQRRRCDGDIPTRTSKENTVLIIQLFIIPCGTTLEVASLATGVCAAVVRATSRT